MAEGAGGDCRLILFHQQRTSARTRFLRFADTVPVIERELLRHAYEAIIG